ncbi:MULTISPECIES: YWFCY domain-containing protein [Bacteroides]|uniref:YWFCY domain-containing protein n=1 Tax=Bacteroides TaxID=816 RepID=UPI0009B80FEF|nr:YWFCY domain-containing protein [Bacteroides fragilis]MDA1490734.1 YWFCY domain-containing protein [Bacteroides fragilis]
MSQEDARGLGKTTDFMRAVSILFLVMNVYYFCYPFFHRKYSINSPFHSKNVMLLL